MSTSLVRYEAARAALAEARRVDEVKDIRDKAQAMAAYARQAKDTALVEWATEIKVRAERRAGELLAEVEREKGGRGKTDSKLARVYEEHGIAPSTAHRWQKLAAVPEEQFEAAVQAAKETAGEVTTAALLRMGSGLEPLMSSESVEWYTPPEIIQAVVTVLGAIDLDPCANHDKTVPAAKHFTHEDDGLTQPWAGRVYMNPPYGRGIEQWVEKLVRHYNHGTVTEAIALVPARTDTDWFRKFGGFVRCFIAGRLKFSQHKDAAPFPSAVVYLGKNTQGFYNAFRLVGHIHGMAWTDAKGDMKAA